MKFSYNWLQTFFDSPLPVPAVIEDKLTFHSSEVEEVVEVNDDVVFDIKVLPDKSAWLLSHRGLAKELSVILDKPLKQDPLAGDLEKIASLSEVRVRLDAPICDYYGAILIEGVTVGPSPVWLKEKLEAIGQRSINNIVDATNYVMFEIGQPLHAFDANTFVANADEQKEVCVRKATAGEKLVTLSQEELSLTSDDTVITDGVAGTILALAGVKGGLNSGVTEKTNTILLEGAHFDRVATRLSSQRHKLPTDASKRYENGLSRSVAPYGLIAGAKLIAEISGGTIKGISEAGDCSVVRKPVVVSVDKINKVLGVTISSAEIDGILRRFGYLVSVSDEKYTVTPPHERDDLIIAEDLVEEVGRIYGLTQVASIKPSKQVPNELNTRHFYAEKVRLLLTQLGFSEVYTSSFRLKDEVHLKNSLATDKEYLRSRLLENLVEVRERNLSHRDLLGLDAVKVFELGTVFSTETEAFHLGLAVQSGTSYKEKIDGPLLTEVVEKLQSILNGKSLNPIHSAPGYIEYSFDSIVSELKVPVVYEQSLCSKANMLYSPFSVYPAVSRDISLWVGERINISDVENVLRDTAGPLLARLTHLDTFSKEGKTSLAFRLVFQSNEKTLDGNEIEVIMVNIYEAIKKAGWEVR